MQILAGAGGVKPDRMICRLISDSLGLPRRGVTPKFTLEILTGAAAGMGMSSTDLDHAVWQFQRSRKQTFVAHATDAHPHTWRISVGDGLHDLRHTFRYGRSVPRADHRDHWTVPGGVQSIGR